MSDSTVIVIPPAHSFVYDGARLNVFYANKGEGLARHSHNFAHATFCTSGSCHVRKEGKEIIMDKNTQPINLKEIEWHEIEAIEDGTVFINVFSDGKY
jgi:quercetin dioxygenase-like cupin family protein